MSEAETAKRRRRPRKSSETQSTAPVSKTNLRQPDRAEYMAFLCKQLGVDPPQIEQLVRQGKIAPDLTSYLVPLDELFAAPKPPPTVNDLRAQLLERDCIRRNRGIPESVFF